MRIRPPGLWIALGQSPWISIGLGRRLKQDPQSLVPPGGAVAVEECSAGSDATAWVEGRMIGQTARRQERPINRRRSLPRWHFREGRSESWVPCRC